MFTDAQLLKVAVAELEAANASLRKHQALIARQQKTIEFLLTEVKRLKEGREL